MKPSLLLGAFITLWGAIVYLPTAGMVTSWPWPWMAPFGIAHSLIRESSPTAGSGQQTHRNG